jgi:hypothetical protein
LFHRVDVSSLVDIRMNEIDEGLVGRHPPLDPAALFDPTDALAGYPEFSQFDEDGERRWHPLYLDYFQLSGRSGPGTDIVEDDLRTWVEFTDAADSFQGSMTSFCVNVASDKFPVASLVRDNHGRPSLDAIYDTVEEFLAEYEEFMRTRPTAEESDSVKKNHSTDDLTVAIAKKWVRDFSSSVRLDRDLDFYYG